MNTTESKHKAPRTIADVLALAKVANCLSWGRDARTLSLILDDKAADLRLCVEYRAERNVAEIRTLSGFDPAKNMWRNYCGQAGRIEMPDRRGLSALMHWLRDQALIVKRCPNPESFSVFRS